MLAVSRFAAGALGGAATLPQPRGIMGPMTAALGIRAVGSATIAGPHAAARPALHAHRPVPRWRPRTPSASACRRRSTLAYVAGLPARARRASRTRAATATASSARSPTACRSARRSGCCSGSSPPRAGSAAPCASASNGIVLTPDVDSAIDLTVLLRPLARARRGARRRAVGACRARGSARPPAPGTARCPASGRDAGGRPGWVAEAGGARAVAPRSSSTGSTDEAERQRLLDEASAYDELMIAVPPRARGVRGARRPRARRDAVRRGRRRDRRCRP